MKVFRVVSRDFLQKLTAGETDEFNAVLDRLKNEQLSIILGEMTRKEIVKGTEIASIPGSAMGTIIRKMFALTIAIDTKNILQYEVLQEDYLNITEYIKEFLDSYDIKILET